MKALVQRGYGSPAVLKVSDVAMPQPTDEQVLVRIRAASVNALDWHMTRGMPYPIRMSEGFRTPTNLVRGIDLAGSVEAVGTRVTGFQPGDQVFGGTNGSFAEYTVTTPDRLARIPVTCTPEEAATLHVAALTALQGLRDKGKVQSGQRVLVNGAGGGVGTFAVQIARWLGAHVTAVTRAEHSELVRALGAHDVIDYRTRDFTRGRERYDVCFDISGTSSLTACCRALTPTGTLVVVGAPAGRWLAPAGRLLKAVLLSPFVRRRLAPFISKNDAEGLALLAHLAEQRIIRPVIDRTYPLQHAADAVAYVGTGNARGKVVVAIA